MILLFSSLIFFQSAFGNELDSLHPKYLDSHVHTAGIGGGNSGCFLSKELKASFKYGLYLKAFDVTEKDLLNSGDKLILKKISDKLSKSKTVGAAIILALDGVIDSFGNLDSSKTQIYIPNSFVENEIKNYPNLFFGASINPVRKNAIEEIQRVKDQGALLIKWIPSIMNIDPADSALIPFYLAMKKANLPLLTHTGKESSFLEAKDSLCDPMRLKLPLSLGLTVIAAHVGTPGKTHGQENMERAIELMKLYPNLYADISSLTQINKLFYLKRILNHREILGRLIYGSDFPLIETALVSPYYFAFRAPIAKLRAAAKEKNPWDRDVYLKRALKVPEGIFLRTDSLLLSKSLIPNIP